MIAWRMSGLGSWARRLRHLGRRWWGNYRWLVSTVVVSAAVVLGFIGFGQHPGGPTYPELGFFERVYDTLLLFRFSTSAPPPFSPALEVARWLALLSTAYVVVAGLRALFVEQWSQARARFGARNHMIVCGAGEMGRAVALDCVSRGIPTVVVDRSSLAVGVAPCRAAGIPVLTGDATDPIVLSRAQLRRARHLVAACGNDDVNIDIVMQAQALSAECHGRLRTCWANIDDDGLCQLLESSALAGPGEQGRSTEFFNLYRGSPAAVLDRYGESLGTAPAPHLVVVGDGQLGRNMVLEAARRWRSRLLAKPESTSAPSPRLLVTVVATAASTMACDLECSEPALASLVELCPVDLDLARADAPVATLARGGPPHAVVVCLEDQASGLRAALKLRQLVEVTVPIVVTTSVSSGVARLLERDNLPAMANIKAFDLEDEVSWGDLLLFGRLGTLARAIHNDYRRRMAASAKPGSAAAMTWDELPEGYKAANRDQAADIARKLATVGCRMVQVPTLAPPPFSFTPAEVEQLAVMEHDRWAAERRGQGWSYGPVRDDSAKKHPALVPWAELDERLRDLDRDTVRNIPAFLAEAGYAVVRPGSPPGS